MNAPRTLRLALCALLVGAGSGCRTAGVNDLARRDTTLAPRVSWKADELLSAHNENARKIQSLEARPSVTLNRSVMWAGIGGKLALERPRNFNLTLASTAAGEVANIGSNDREFWFWIKDSDPKAVFFCNYEDQGKNPLGSSLQPDWIVESLGLQPFDREALAGATVKPGEAAGTLVVTQKPHAGSAATGDPQAPAFLKETVVAESTRRVIEQRIYTPDRRTLLARATVADHQQIELPAPMGEAPSTVDLPRKLRLEWTQEKMILDVVLNKVKVNATFEEERRAALFAKPVYEGYAEVNLAGREGLAVFEPQEGAPGTRAGGRTTLRQSRPSPPPRVRLSEPSPIGSRPARVEESDVALNVPTLAAGVEPLVSPRIPTVSEPSRAYIEANPGWKGRFGPPSER